MPNLCQIPPCFVGTVISRNQYPILLVSLANQIPRSSLPGSRCSKENAGIKKKPHRLTLRGVARKVAISASSRAIHRSIVALGMSRMGIATAACKKRPPSHSSTRTMGLLSLSKPSFRRRAGGSVREPRLLRVIVVAMQQCCMDAMRHSSANCEILLWSVGGGVGMPVYLRLAVPFLRVR